MRILIVIGLINVSFVLWRLWAAGMFETGLERVFGYTEAE